MLRQLNISNYALIDSVELTFEKGMTAITGETGSGKSILLGAFGLLLGERADTKAIKDESLKCIVEATFNLKGYGLKNFFADNDLDYEVQTTIRREISPGGKNRAFVNDTPVQLTVLRALGSVLVDIHSQHENSLLGQRSFQFDTVDAFAGNGDAMRDYEQSFAHFRTLRKELEDLQTNEARIRQELDYTRFQWNELDKAALESLNQTMMEQELETLTHAEQIKSALVTIASFIEAENTGVIAQLNATKSSLQKIAPFNIQLQEFSQRTDSCLIELRELMREMEGFESNVQLDEKKTEVLNEKLSGLYHLQQKHRLQTTEDLIALRDELEKKCGGYENIDEHIAQLQLQIEQSRNRLIELSGQLSASRKKAASKAETEVKKYFEALSLEHAELKIELTEAADFNEYGKDEIQFLFRANKGGQLLPVKQVASGGEISRVMLALKASISQHKQLPVLILDEIDQGVSGEVGKKIGSVLKAMSTKMQLLTITHLPQIAGKAEHHMKVYKKTAANSTTTYVETLNEEDRINELAEMLSGKSYSKAAIENAKELMGGQR